MIPQSIPTDATALDGENSRRAAVSNSSEVASIGSPKMETKVSYQQANRLLIGNFLAAQNVVIREMVALGHPLADFFRNSGIERPLTPDRRTDPLPFNEGNRQGKFGWDQQRSLELLFARADRQARLGEVTKLHDALEAIERFICGFDFSLIERIYDHGGKYTAPYWNRDQEMIEPRSDARLHSEMRKARQIRDKILTANMKLVRSEVSNWCSRSQYKGESHPDYMDLYQEGLIGLSNGIGKLSFDMIEKNISLSTIVIKWIQHGIRRWHDKFGKTIKVPSCKKERIRAVLKAKKTLSEQLGSEPSFQQIAKECKLSVKQVTDVISAISCGAVSSLNMRVEGADKKGTEIGDILEIEDQNIDNLTGENVESRDAVAMLSAILEDLSPESRFVLCAQSGINGLPEASKSLIDQMIEASKMTEQVLFTRVKEHRLYTASIDLSDWPEEFTA